ncbi:MAG: hypothetical protein ACYCOU_22380 [Sulfobacillus sp.]
MATWARIGPEPPLIANRFLDDLQLISWSQNRFEQAQALYAPLKLKLELTNESSASAFTASFLDMSFKVETGPHGDLIIHTRVFDKVGNRYEYITSASNLPKQPRIGVVKGVRMRLATVNSSRTTFDEDWRIYRIRLLNREYEIEMLNSIEKEVSQDYAVLRQRALTQPSNRDRTHDPDLLSIYVVRNRLAVFSPHIRTAVEKALVPAGLIGPRGVFNRVSVVHTKTINFMQEI